MTRGVDKGDCSVDAVVLHVYLVGPDVLGDPTCLIGNHVRLADRVEQPGLTVIDVTHHRHYRWARHQFLFATLVIAEGQVEGLEQFAVLVLGTDHLYDVVELGTEQLQGLFVDRLGCGDHLAEMEHHGNQRGWFGVDLVGEVGQRSAARQPQDLTTAARDLYPTQRGCRHVVEFLTTLLLALATAGRSTTLPAERTCGAGAATATAGTTTTGTRAEAAATTGCTTTTAWAAAIPAAATTSWGSATGTATVSAAATTGSSATGPTGATGTTSSRATGTARTARRTWPRWATRTGWHHARIRAWWHHAGIRTRAAGAGATARTRGAGARLLASAGTCRTGRGRPGR